MSEPKNIPVTQLQKNKLIALAKRFNEKDLLQEARDLIVDEDANNNGVGAWYGSLYVVVVEDGSSHS